ncbi:MAG: cytochrome c biogenesis protein CcsA [Calditrichaceae bacterium]|nr:cytochrome c biogenesis protein CcsA [Calditrichaceae bacterium]
MKTISYTISYLLPLFYLAVVILYYRIFTGTIRTHPNKTTPFLVGLLIIHILELAIRTFSLSTMPLSSIHDSFSFLALSILFVYIIIELSLNNRASGLFILSFAFILEVISTFYLTWEKETSELLTNPYFAIHASMSVMGYTALSLSAIYALMYIIQNRNLKKKKMGLLYSQLPALSYLEKMSIRSVVIGIILLGLGIMHGHIQSNRVFGTYFPMDPKVLLSDAIWLFYFFGYLLSRIMKWRGRWMANLALSGFFVLLIVSGLVMFFMESFHRFF